MSFAVTDERGDFEYASTSANGLFAKRAQPRLAPLPPDAARRAALPARGARAAALATTAAVARRLARAAALLARRSSTGVIVPQAAAVWSADPRQMWSFPARFLRRVLRQPRDARAARPAALARGRPAARARYVEALSRRSRDRIRTATPVRAIRAPRRPRDGQAARRRARALRPRGPRHALRPGAARCSPTRRRREHELLGAIPYQPNEAVLHTDARLLPRRRRAWASWNYHLLDAAGRPPDRHLPHEPPAVARRARAVLRDAQPHATRSTPAKVIRTIEYAHPVYTSAGAGGAGAATTRSAAGERTHFCGAYWGWGFHEDGVASAVAGRRALRGRRAVSRAARSTRARSATAASRSASASSATAWRCSTSTSTSSRRCSAGGSSRARPGLVRFRRADYLGDPAQPLADAVRALVARAHRRRPGRPGPAAHPAAHVRALLQPGQLLLLLRAGRRAPRGRRRRGHEHALGRAPRLRARRASGDGRGARRRAPTRRCTSRRSWRMDQRYALARHRARARRCRSTSPSSEDGAPRLRRDAEPAPPPAHAALAGERDRALPGGDRCASSALIYGHALAL